MLSYRAGIDFLIPFLRYGKERVSGTAWELTNVNSYVSLSLHPVKWMSFAWNLAAMREAAIRPDFQLHNYLIIAFTYANKSRGKTMR